MARISGVNLPLNKQVHIALQYIYGIGDHYADKICQDLNIEKSKRVNNLVLRESNSDSAESLQVHSLSITQTIRII